MKRLALIILSLAVCSAPAVAQMAPALPGVTVYVTGTATTTDVLVNLSVNATLTAKPNTAAVFAEGAKALGKITAAAGPTATVHDNGARSPGGMPGMPGMTMSMGNITENATVAVAPADLAATTVRLTAAHLTVDSMSVVARDPDALDAQALAAALKAARVKAGAIAAADGRTIGKLTSVGPSYTSLFKDAMSSFIPTSGPLASIFSSLQGQSLTATATDGGSFTFELAP